MTSATSERSIKKAKEQQRYDGETDRLIVQTIMQTPRGRRWVWIQLSEAAIFSSHGALELKDMYFAEGMRNSGLRLLKSVTTYSPTDYVKMLEENSGRKLIEDEDETDETA